MCDDATLYIYILRSVRPPACRKGVRPRSNKIVKRLSSKSDHPIHGRLSSAAGHQGLETYWSVWPCCWHIYWWVLVIGCYDQNGDRLYRRGSVSFLVRGTGGGMNFGIFASLLFKIQWFNLIIVERREDKLRVQDFDCALKWVSSLFVPSQKHN